MQITTAQATPSRKVFSPNSEALPPESFYLKMENLVQSKSKFN
jgi:hypothetical protein